MSVLLLAGLPVGYSAGEPEPEKSTSATASATADTTSATELALEPKRDEPTSTPAVVVNSPSAEFAARGGHTVGRAWTERLEAMGIEPAEFMDVAPPTTTTDEERRGVDARQHLFYGSYYLIMDEPSHAYGEFSAALEDEPNNTGIMLGQAQAKLAAKQLDEASQLLDKILAADPRNIRALILKARLLMARAESAGGNQRQTLLASAMEAFEQAKAIQPKNLEILKGIAAGAVAQQNVAGIEKAYRDIVDVNPKDTYSMLVLANVLSKIGKQPEAVDIYQRIIDQRPGFTNAYIYLGMLKEEMKKDREAAELYKAALVIEPRNEQIQKKFEAVIAKMNPGRERGPILAEYEKFAKAYPYSAEIQRIYANQLANAGDVDRAVAQFKKVLDLDPENVEALIETGKIYRMHKKYDEANTYFSKAVDISPDKVDVYDEIAEGYANQKEWDKAVEVYEKAIKLNPKVDKLYLSLAVLYDQQGKAREARETMEQAISHIGEKPEFDALIGQFLEKANDLPKAEEYYEKALALSPDNWPLLSKLLSLYIKGKQEDKIGALVANGLDKFKDRKGDFFSLIGETYQAEGDMETAASYYEKARADSPEKPILLARLAQYYNHSGQFDKSLAMLDEALAAHPTNDDIKRVKAETLLDKKDYDKAIPLYNEFVDEKPDSLDSYRLLVDALCKAGRADEALATVKKAEDKIGKSDETEAVKALAYYQLKRYDAAEKIFKDLAQKKGKSNDVYYYTLGSIYLDQEKYDAAEKSLKKAIELNPNNDSALNALGYMYAMENIKLPEAKQLVEKALEINPGAPHILDSLGWVYFRMGKTKEAREYVEKAYKMMGEDAEIFDHLGDIYAATGDVAKAVDFWKKSLAMDKTRVAVRAKISKNEGKLQ